MRSLPWVVAALLLAGCAHVPASPPSASATGFTFEAHDGSGTYFSATHRFRPEYCGTHYRERALDIGQTNLDRVERLVDEARVWDARIEAIPGCTPIAVVGDPHRFRFDRPGRSLTLEWGRCERVAGKQGQALADIARVVRAQSDRLTLKVEAACIRL
jgi:hypothetical protein